MRIAHLDVRPLSVPLVEPFVISTGRVEATRAALVVARLANSGRSDAMRGLGEAAALPPVTRVDQPELMRHVSRACAALTGQSFAGPSELEALLDDVLLDDPVARAGVETALYDAWARLEGVAAHVLLGSAPHAAGSGPFSLTTDITIPIARPEHMGARAASWRSLGFRSFKVKVGKNIDDDVRAVEEIGRRVPDALLRLDGNGALSSGDAMSLIAVARGLRIDLECFEQPCAPDDLDGMARVTALAGCPVIADESVTTLEQLERVITAKAATGVNLKLMKHGGLVAAGRIGRAAQRAGFKIMVGAMVETRLGLVAMAHVARALGHVDFVDLDTSLLLRWDPFVGGIAQQGPQMVLKDAVGLDVSEAPPSA